MLQPTPPFLIALFGFAFLALYWFAAPASYRPRLVLATSAGIILLYSPAYAFLLFLTILLASWTAKVIERGGRWATPAVTCAVLVLVVLLLSWKAWLRLKTDLTPLAVMPLGLSFMTFRLIHYLVEVRRRVCRAVSPLDLAHYCFFFPTLIAGPLEPFPSFSSGKNDQAMIAALDLQSGMARILWGTFKKFVIADSLASWIGPILSNPELHPRYLVALSVFGATLRIYFDFSGYTDIAIGAARLLGYRISENFDRPFFKTNVAEYWRSWHISMHVFIRNYFFFPFFGTGGSAWRPYVGAIASMVVFGLWHSLELRFLVFGLIQGVMIASCQKFKEIKRRLPRLRTQVESAPGRALSIAVTFVLVCSSNLLFNFSVTKSLQLIGYVFHGN